MAAVPRTEVALSQEQYAAIARFRHELRSFLAFSEVRAAEEGLPAQQHQALLAIAGLPEGEPPSVGYVAEQLLVAPHTAAELVARMVEAGLLIKGAAAQDRRRAELTLTPHARALLERLTQAHLEELASLEPALVRALNRVRAKGVSRSS